MNIRTQTLDVGANTPMLWLFEERQKIMEFYMFLVPGCTLRPGGLAQDLSESLLSDIKAWLQQFPDKLSDIETLLNNKRILKQRLVDVGVVSQKNAMDWGFSVPMLCGSGIAWDLRKSNPYVYAVINFEVPVCKNGYCYHRYFD